MSSDSNDIDEDELLQIALREQAQRDLNYRRPGDKQPSKPVRNYVQPPPQPAAAANQRAAAGGRAPNATMQHKQRKPVEEDDDSDVEMLSISSGDEDSSKDRGFGERNRAAAGGGRGGKNDEKAWDGGEPGCWKHVDEAEVSNIICNFIYLRSSAVALFEFLIFCRK